MDQTVSLQSDVITKSMPDSIIVMKLNGDDKYFEIDGISKTLLEQIEKKECTKQSLQSFLKESLPQFTNEQLNLKLEKYLQELLDKDIINTKI